MSKDFLKQSLEKMSKAKAWSLQLLAINSTGGSVAYFSRQIGLTPEGKIKSIADDLVKKYLSNKGIDAFSGVDNYTGDVVGNVIYKIEGDDQLIKTELSSLFNVLDDPDTESSIDVKQYQAYLLRTTIQNENQTIPVELVSMQMPVSTISNKFLLGDKGSNFHEITEPVLTLRKSIDVIILGSTVYMLTLAGENLFAMDRAYKTVCQNKVAEVIGCGFISDSVHFKKIATSGQNPRRFVSYNQTRLDALKNGKTRIKFAKKFGMDLNGNIINTSDDKTSERLVKFLCNKAMQDPLNSAPVEVSAAKSWQ